MERNKTPREKKKKYIYIYIIVSVIPLTAKDGINKAKKNCLYW